METITCSIIIPSYNHGRHIERSIGSALSQTLKGFEVIVVDDGSTDDTPARAGQFGNRIRYIRQANGGLGSARNTGIKASRGSYLQFLDADDYIAPAKLELQVAAMTANRGVDVVYSDCTMTGPDSEGRSYASRPINEQDPLATLVKDNPIPVHAAVIRKEAVLMAGMYDESRAIHEDWDLWIRLALKGSRFLYLPGDLAHYHREASVISANQGLMFDRAKSLLDKHVRNPEMIASGRAYLDRFVATQYLLLAANARGHKCWELTRSLLFRAAKADWRSLTLRLWLYFPETVLHQALDVFAGKERAIPDNIRRSI